MNRKDFTKEIRGKLNDLPEKDVNSSIDYYNEMINDRIEDGLSEEEAIAALGSTDEIVLEIRKSLPLSQLIKEKVSNNKKLKTWQLVLLIIGFPVWLPLLLAAIVTTFSLYIALISIVFSLYIATIGIAAGSILAIVNSIIIIIQGKQVIGVFYLGASLMLIGIAILMYFMCKGITKAAIKLGANILSLTKRIFV